MKPSLSRTWQARASFSLRPPFLRSSFFLSSSGRKTVTIDLAMPATKTTLWSVVLLFGPTSAETTYTLHEVLEYAFRRIEPKQNIIHSIESEITEILCARLDGERVLTNIGRHHRII
jgi:hypothetical protein